MASPRAVGGVNWMTSARQSECPPTLKEGEDMTKTTKTAGRTRKTAKTRATSSKAQGTTRARDPRLPASGTVLKRTYKGKEVRVTVLDAGFRFEGNEFRSLTAVALAITGYPAISGPHFFKLDGRATTTRTPAETATV